MDFGLNSKGDGSRPVGARDFSDDSHRSDTRNMETFYKGKGTLVGVNLKSENEDIIGDLTSRMKKREG